MSQSMHTDPKNSPETGLAHKTEAEQSFETLKQQIGEPLNAHLQKMVNKYCEDIPQEQKEKLFSRISGLTRPNLVPEYFSWLSNVQDAYPQDGKAYKNMAPEVKNILDRFAGNSSAVSKDLKSLLDNSDVKIIIRDKQNPNGNAALKKAQKPGEKNQIVIALTGAMFTEQYRDKIPELLGHEVGHLLDFAARETTSDGAIWQSHEVESFGDIAGTMLAANAGYKCGPWGKFLQESHESGVVFDDCPTGTYKKQTIDVTLAALEHSPLFVRRCRIGELKNIIAQKSNDKPSESPHTPKSLLAELSGRTQPATPSNKQQKTQTPDSNSLRQLRYLSNSGR